MAQLKNSSSISIPVLYLQVLGKTTAELLFIWSKIAQFHPLHKTADKQVIYGLATTTLLV